MDDFKMDASDFVWINGEADDSADLCLHGHMEAVIGGRVLSFDGTVSAAALYLLKTITEDHFMHCDNQIFPCCGHFMIANADLSNVTIVGCNKGIDWTVCHEGEQVKIILEDGFETAVSLEHYKREVYAFADKVEAYYSKCTPKTLPADEFVRNGYTAFWNEWHSRRNPMTTQN